MTDRSISITHNGVNYDGIMATIRRTSLGWEDHGILTAFLHCEWPGGGVGVGGFCLDVPIKDDPKYRREGTAYGLDHIMRVLETVGVNEWEQLPGRHVLVLFEGGRGAWGSTSKGIAHATDEKKVLIHQEHAEEWRARSEREAVSA